eukprot:TRINITY_DN110138_c0_g1_i1.p1 TRINITY_DN110138_c0_g1~~TRINITY_DN110138_c0_g1_i1.p1  ORF type:complete len:710 (-),score=125.51 TRINITY_DN110138_c0_g1_i1:47-2176(-)
MANGMRLQVQSLQLSSRQQAGGKHVSIGETRRDGQSVPQPIFRRSPSRYSRASNSKTSSRSLPSLPRGVAEFMSRKQLLFDISTARQQQDAEKLRSLLKAWQDEAELPEEVAMAKADLSRWDSVQRNVGEQLLDAIQRQDVNVVRMQVQEIQASGPSSLRGLKEARALLSHYDEQAKRLDAVTATRNSQLIQEEVAAWGFPGGLQEHECLRRAQAALEDVAAEEELSARQEASRQLHQLVDCEPPDLPSLRRAVDSWSFSDAEDKALAAAKRALSEHEEAVHAALASQDGWALRSVWEAGGEGFALSEESYERLVDQVMSCLIAHEDQVTEECQQLVGQRHRFRDQNFVTWIPALVKATSKTSISDALQHQDIQFWPRSWCYPKLSLDQICKEAFGCGTNGVLVKPALSSQGWGISLALSGADLQRQLCHLREEEALIQEYIDRPLLLSGRKWDIRLYALIIPRARGTVTSFLAREGLARVCAEPYQQADARNQHRMTVHLTNYSVAKYSPNYDHSGRPEDGAHGCKRLVSAVFKELDRQVPGFSAPDMWRELQKLAQDTLQFALNPWVTSCPDEAAFHLLGLDVLIGEDCKPWLLEVNTKPSLDFDEVRPLPVAQTRAAVNQLFVNAGRQRSCKRTSGSRATRWGQPCRCGAIAPVHCHQPCPVDLAVKAPVIDDALGIAGRAASKHPGGPSAWAEGTIFQPTADTDG